MKNIQLSLAFTYFLSCLLVACGGGGGNGGPTNFIVDGTGSKGLLSGALVQAYTYDANGVRTKVGDSVKTDANGRYILSLPASSKPVVIEITAIEGTKMLDESAALIGGSFPSIDAPSGLVIRTAVPSLAANATVQANVYTEAAVYAALNAKNGGGNPVPLSPEVFDAAKAAVRATLPQGINPFTIPGVNANNDSATSDEKMLTTLYAGVAKFAKDSGGSCHNDSTGITCAIARINDSSRIVVDGTNHVSFADAGLQYSINQSVIDKAKTVNNAFVVAMRGTLPPAVQMDDTIDPEVFKVRDSLSAFIKSMRDGFNATQTTLKNAAADFTQRTKNLRAIADYTGGDDFSKALRGCQTTETTFTCANTAAPTAVTYSSNGNGGYDYSYYSVMQGVRFKVSGAVTALIDSQKHNISFTITANRIVDTTQKKVSDSSVTLSVSSNSSALLSNCLGCAGNIMLSAKIYDNNDQSKFATLIISNASVVFSISNGIATNAMLSGGFTLSSSDGDNISGSFSAAADAISVGVIPQSQLKSANVILDFSGKLSNSNILSGSMTINRDANSYNPLLPYSLTNLPKDTTTVTLTFAGRSGITSTQIPSVIDLNKRTVTLKVFADSSNFVTLTQSQQFIEKVNTWYPFGNYDGAYSYSYSRWDWDLVPNSKTILRSSSGDYSAQLDLANSFSGPLLHGATQIGEIRDNVIYVTGQEVSLY